MNINSSEFVTSIGTIANYKNSGFPEVTFVGRSNVGKSSLINALTNRKNLAKTSSLAGRTRLINMFFINQRFMLVDLPGYGYAKASKEAQKEWQTLIGGYLQSSNTLKMVFVLVDIRIMPSELDKQMLQFLYFYNIPFKVVATKSDKLSKSQVNINLNKIALELGLGIKDVLCVSSETKFGIDSLLNYIAEIIDYDNLKANPNYIDEINQKRKELKMTALNNKKQQNIEKSTKPAQTKNRQKVQNKEQHKNKEKITSARKNTRDSKNDKSEKSKVLKIKHTPRYALKNKKGKK